MVATQGGDKGGQVMAIIVENDTVISVPGTDCFLGAMGDGPYLMKCKLSVMGLSVCMKVEGLETTI